MGKEVLLMPRHSMPSDSLCQRTRKNACKFLSFFLCIVIMCTSLSVECICRLPVVDGKLNKRSAKRLDFPMPLVNDEIKSQRWNRIRKIAREETIERDNRFNLPGGKISRKF